MSDAERPKVCPKCGSTEFFSVEYAYGSEHRYDGISEYACKNGDYRQGRWTGFELHDGEAEPRYGLVRVKRPGGWQSIPASRPAKASA